MAQRGRGPSEGTRASVMDAALRKFSEKSFLGATTAEIAEGAGVSEKTIFDLFGDKKTLYLAVRASLREDMLKDVIPRMPLGGGAPAMLRGLGREFLHYVRDNQDKARVSVQAISIIGDPEIRKSVREIFINFQQFIKGILTEGQKSDLVRDDIDLEQVSWAFTMACYSLAYLQVMDFETPIDDEAAVAFIDRTVAYIEPGGK